MPAALVAAAFLFCHGAFGHAHQLEATGDPASPAKHTVAHAVAHAAGPDAPHPAPHPAPRNAGGEHESGVYFATLLAFFAASLPLFLARSIRTELPAAAFSGLRAAPGVFRLPRAPTLPVLQVFRL